MTKLETIQEKDLELAIVRLERTENDVKETLENLWNIKERSYIKIGDGLVNLEVKEVLTKYLRKNTFDDLLLIIANLASEQGRHFTFYQAK